MTQNNKMKQMSCREQIIELLEREKENGEADLSGLQKLMREYEGDWNKILEELTPRYAGSAIYRAFKKAQTTPQQSNLFNSSMSKILELREEAKNKTENP